MTLEMIHKTSEVYGISRELPLNYVSRRSADDALIDNLTRNKHLVIFGSSKQGKTSLRKKCLLDEDYIVVHCSNKWGLEELHSAILKSAGYVLSQSTTKTETGKAKVSATLKMKLFGSGVEGSTETASESTQSSISKPIELDPSDVNDIIKALEKFTKFIVLEDFHYLPIETQKDFAVALKAFHEQSPLCFIIVAVWLEEGRLTVYNGDLTGRIFTINADNWTRLELEEVIATGEALLNISFTEKFKKILLDNSLESVYIVQESCFLACMGANINETQSTTQTLGDQIDILATIKSVVNQQTGRYNSFLTQFAAGFQDTTLEMYKWILFPVLNAEISSLEQGLRYSDLRKILQQNHPQGSSLNSGNLTQALQFVASLQVKKEIMPIVLDYDQTNLLLRVVDRGFLIWLKNQTRQELLDLVDLPSTVQSQSSTT